MDFSITLLEAMMLEQKRSSVILTESDLLLLNEGFVDFFKSLKNMAIEKIEKLVKLKYEQLEKLQKENENFLKKNNIDTTKISTIINNIIIKYKSEIESAGRKSQFKKLVHISKQVAEDTKEELEKSKRKWFGIKYWDPTKFLLPLVTALVILIVKAIILAFAVAVFPLSSTITLTGVIYYLLVVFILMPILEESGRLFTIKQDVGGAYSVIFNIADFGLMFATKIMIGGSVISFLITRVFVTVMHIASHGIQRIGNITDQSEVSFRIAWVFNMIKSAIETIMLFPEIL